MKRGSNGGKNDNSISFYLYIFIIRILSRINDFLFTRCNFFLSDDIHTWSALKKTILTRRSARKILI